LTTEYKKIVFSIDSIHLTLEPFLFF